jgi:hypothetical protein
MAGTTFSKPRLGRPHKYPWKLWMSGHAAYRLRQGIDYHCATSTMVSQFSRKARQLGHEPRWQYPPNMKHYDATEVTVWVVRDGQNDPIGLHPHILFAARLREEAAYDETLSTKAATMMESAADLIEEMVAAQGERGSGE